MTTGLLSQQVIDTTSTDPFVPWSRPADWLTFTDPTVGQEKIVILAAVYEGGGNFMAFTISGAYTVDWGDGAGTTNVAAGTKTSKQLLWSSYGSGTLTSKGFRQAVITITPQAGQSFTSVDTTVAHSSPPNSTYSTTWLDFVIAGPNIAAFTLGGNGPLQSHRMLERARFVGPNMITDFAFKFNGLQSLRTMAATNGQGYDLWTSSAVTFNAMFTSCGALEACPAFSSSSLVTATGSMFNACGALRSVPLFNTSSVTTAASMFAFCSALTALPAFDWSSLVVATSIVSGCSTLSSVPWTVSPVLASSASMFLNCTLLTSVPALDWSKVTTLNGTFSGCWSLTDTSALGHATKGTTSLCTDMASTFNGCRSLVSVAAMDTSGVTTLNSTFNGCVALTGMPTPSGNYWKTTACTNFIQTWLGCTALRTLPLFDTSNVTNFTSCLQQCSALVSVAAWNVASGTVFTNIVNTCSSLQSAPFVGARFSISYTGCMLSAAALDAIYTALGTASGAQTITVTFNYGNVSDTPSIATGKGWTVTG